MKKFLALVLSVVMVASLAACGNSGTKETQAPASGDSETAAESTAAESTGETAEKVGEGVDVKDLKVGFIFIGDEKRPFLALPGKERTASGSKKGRQGTLQQSVCQG